MILEKAQQDKIIVQAGVYKKHSTGQVTELDYFFMVLFNVEIERK